MKEILLEHGNRYPDMGPEDAVKLLYQSEFGGGHMISDPDQSLRRLIDEKKGLVHAAVCGDGGFLEKIGQEMCRVYLSALDDGLSPETLNQMFVRTAQQNTGQLSSFEGKLALLRRLCRDGGMPFDPEALDQYLERCKSQGYPAVSHSQTYKNRYHPSYRVVSRRYTDYFQVFRQIDQALKNSGKDQLVVAIDGMCGSGKTTLGSILEEIYDCNLFHMDDFFLQPQQRTGERLEEAGGNVDYERFRKEVLERLKDPQGLCYQVYDCSRQRLGRKVHADRRRLNLVEGAYSQHPYFGDAYDLRFFCRIPEDEQIRRIRRRNGDEMLKRFREEWIPMENRYFAAFGIQDNSVPVTAPFYGTPGPTSVVSATGFSLKI